MAIFYELWVCFRSYQKVLVVVIFGEDFYDGSELADKCVIIFMEYVVNYGKKFSQFSLVLYVIFLPKQKCFGAGP
jgi:hypothetical protein